MLNNVTLSGNLGHDPETRHFGEKNEQPVTSFSLAFRVYILYIHIGNKILSNFSRKLLESVGLSLGAGLKPATNHLYFMKGSLL